MRDAGIRELQFHAEGVSERHVCRWKPPKRSSSAWTPVALVAVAILAVNYSRNRAAPILTAEASPGFGSQPLGAVSPVQDVFMSNSGFSVVRVSEVAVTGPHGEDFAVVTDQCTGTTIEPGKGCTVSVQFTPQASGERNASLTFRDPRGESVQVVPLAGTGSPVPLVALNTDNLTFGSQEVGSATPRRDVVVLANRGLSVLNIDEVAITGRGTENFAIEAGNCTNTPVEPGNQCSVVVAFQPRTSGSHQATLRISDNAADSPQTVALNGLGTLPHESRSGGFGVDRRPSEVTVTSESQPPEVPAVTNFQPPILRHRVEPSYPPQARRMAVTGVVVVEATVETDGTVQKATVVEGHRLLRQSALDAVAQWRFTPGTLGGTPVPWGLRIKVTFTLH